MKSKLYPQVLSVLGAAVCLGSLHAPAPAAAASTTSSSVASSVAAVASTSVDDVRVGSFNLFGVNNDPKANAERRPWRERRPAVAAQIMAQKLDVVGLQEANQSGVYKSRLDYGGTQYLDLKGALQAKGGNYVLTNENAYNCVRPSSTYKCVAKDQGATGSTRILYNAATVSLVRQGGYQYDAATEGKPKRFLAWAVFRMKATGKQFLFTDTHLDPYSIPTRTRQWDELIAKVHGLQGSLPVVNVGDYNTSKFSTYAPTYLPRMRAEGFGDVVNQEPQRNTLRTPRAEVMKHAWVNSYNAFRRDVRSYAYEDARQKIGNGIDWVFASNQVRVKEWEVVVDMDPTTLALRGVIPSDHALVRATLVLP